MQEPRLIETRRRLMRRTGQSVDDIAGFIEAKGGLG